MTTKRKFAVVGLGAVIGVALAACAAKATKEEPHYTVTARIQGSDGEYDYVSVDSAGGRLFVGREDGVMQLDLRSRKMKTLLSRRNVAAALHIPEQGLVLTTNGGSDTATLLDPDTGEVKADLPTGHEPDGALYDSRSGVAIVMNGGDGTATFIDVAGAKVLASVALGGKPEAGVSDASGHAFINIEDTNEIAVVDIAKREVIRRFNLGSCIEPTGIEFDGESGLLIVACHNRMAKLVDAKTGRIASSFEIGAGADGAIFDARRRIGAISCIDGTLTMFTLGRDGAVKARNKISTADGARTVGLDPITGALYLPAATVVRDAKGEYVTARRNFSIVVVAPQRARDE